MSAPPRRPSEVKTQAHELAPLVRAHAADAEQIRRLPAEVVNAFAGAGLLRLSVPQEFGGCQAELSEQIEIIEEVSRQDGAAGWCIMIHATTSLLSGRLQDETLREIFGNEASSAMCGVYAPCGRATSSREGIQLSGRWKFASGCEHSRWFAGGSLLDGRMCLAIVERSQLQIHDTWRVSGLRGTGSHDVEVQGATIPRRRIVDPAGAPTRDGGLYRFPLFGFLAAEVAAVSLGIGRAAIEDFVTLAKNKTPQGGKRTLAQRSTTQLAVADARAEVQAARAYLFDTVGGCERSIAQGTPLQTEDRAQLRLSSSHAVRAAAHAVDKMYEAGGGSSLYETSPIQRQFRDIHAATQHIMVAQGVRELVGRHLLGLDVGELL